MKKVCTSLRMISKIYILIKKVHFDPRLHLTGLSAVNVQMKWSKLKVAKRKAILSIRKIIDVSCFSTGSRPLNLIANYAKNSLVTVHHFQILFFICKPYIIVALMLMAKFNVF